MYWYSIAGVKCAASDAVNWRSGLTNLPLQILRITPTFYKELREQYAPVDGVQAARRHRGKEYVLNLLSRTWLARHQNNLAFDLCNFTCFVNFQRAEIPFSLQKHEYVSAPSHNQQCAHIYGHWQTPRWHVICTRIMRARSQSEDQSNDERIIRRCNGGNDVCCGCEFHA